MTKNSRTQRGGIHPSTLVIIGLIVLVVAAGSLAIWAYMNYLDQKNAVDSKIEVAVAKAEKSQAEADEEKFAEREKEPKRQFVGPDDYGRLTFDYPKTWSVYEATDVSSGRGVYKAYLNPITVPPVSTTARFALRVEIEDNAYEKVLGSYERTVSKGDLKSTTISADGEQGTRLDGQFDKNFRGAAVIFKIRDKTVTIRTDADTFKPDFDALVKTIEFNK